MSRKLQILQRAIVRCERCSRLREHCRNVARTKRRAYLDWEYWGKPVPSFGDPNARLLIVGLAPGAHGANRTGRMFTGDSSGDLLYRVLHDTGFASRRTSVSIDDGLILSGAYITAAAHCAPPDNKPSREELANCFDYLVRELKILPRVRVVVALGRIGFGTYLSAAGLPQSRFAFGHNVIHYLGGDRPRLISSYHPSRQNTSTGRLTEAMLRDVFENARRLVES